MIKGNMTSVTVDTKDDMILHIKEEEYIALMK